MIAGAARGIPLRAPSHGRTRPTAGRLRESLFGMLESAGADLSEVLDLYAGSGALGIEALSRGDGHCTFVESDARACGVIRLNLERTALAERATVTRGRVGRWRPDAGAEFTLVLADPPYDAGGAWQEIERSVTGAVAGHAMVAVEHPAREAPPAALLGWSMWRDRRQGDGAVAVYRSIERAEGDEGNDDA